MCVVYCMTSFCNLGASLLQLALPQLPNCSKSSLTGSSIAMLSDPRYKQYFSFVWASYQMFFCNQTLFLNVNLQVSYKRFNVVLLVTLFFQP